MRNDFLSAAISEGQRGSRREDRAASLGVTAHKLTDGNGCGWSENRETCIEEPGKGYRKEAQFHPLKNSR